MKKWKMAAVIVLCLFAVTVTFNRSEVSVYAYTQDEIDAAKAWLSANGYSPTRAGAEQAYQDYLNGKFGPVGGEKETETTVVPTTEAVTTEAVVETLTAEVASEKVVKSTESVVEETTEILTEETTSTEAETEEKNSSEEQDSIDEIALEESTADMTAENSIEPESSSDLEETGGSLIHVDRYDGIIVVLAIAACAVMGFFTYWYIKKEKKDGE